MSTATFTLPMRRDWLKSHVDELFEAGRFPSDGIVALSPYGGHPRAAKMAIDAATEFILTKVERELNVAEDFGRERDRSVSRAVEGVDRRRDEQERPLTEDEMAAIDAENERHRLIAERRNSTEGRLERIETLLGRIAGALEKR